MKLTGCVASGRVKNPGASNGMRRWGRDLNPRVREAHRLSRPAHWSGLCYPSSGISPLVREKF